MNYYVKIWSLNLKRNQHRGEPRLREGSEWGLNLIIGDVLASETWLSYNSQEYGQSSKYRIVNNHPP